MEQDANVGQSSDLPSGQKLTCNSIYIIYLEIHVLIQPAIKLIKLFSSWPWPWQKQVLQKSMYVLPTLKKSSSRCHCNHTSSLMQLTLTDCSLKQMWGRSTPALLNQSHLYISPVVINIIFVSFLKPGLSKGQLILKCLFGIVNSLNEKIRPN